MENRYFRTKNYFKKSHAFETLLRQGIVRKSSNELGFNVMSMLCVYTVPLSTLVCWFFCLSAPTLGKSGRWYCADSIVAQSSRYCRALRTEIQRINVNENVQRQRYCVADTTFV